MHAENPNFFKAKAFYPLREIIKTEGYDERIANMYAYQAAGLFQSPDRAMQYLKKWGDPTRAQPFHDIVQPVRLPQEGWFNMAAWGDAVLKHGPKMARLVKFADKMPEPMKDAAGKGWSYRATREEISRFAYERGHEHPDLAAMCFEHDWDNEDFEQAVNDNTPGARIPDITIDGEEFDKPGYRFRKLAAGDVKGLFLGEFTNCCQHLAGEGSECAEHGFLSEHGGFYVIENKDNGGIVGQSWAWRGEDGALVFDSLESLSGHFNEKSWCALLSRVSESLQNTQDRHDVTSLRVGTGGDTPKLNFAKAADPSHPVDYTSYRDSETQYQVWERQNTPGLRAG